MKHEGTPMTRVSHRSLDLPRLGLIVVEIEARALGDAPLPPYLGATLRGSLGRALRHAVCVTEAPVCDGCHLIARCPYGSTWEAQAGQVGDLGALGRGEWPRPYVIGVWRAPEHLRAGMTIRFRLVLAGRSRDFLPHYLVALRTALGDGLGPRRVPFVIERAVTTGLTGGPHPDGRGLMLISDNELIPWAALPDTTLWNLVHRRQDLEGRVHDVELATPLALQVEGRLATTFNLEALVARLCERIDRLQLAWGGGFEPLLDFPVLQEQARSSRVVRIDTRLVAFERRSERSGRVPMQGIVGRVRIADLPPAVVSLLAAVEWIHVGKQATFGFGRLGVRAARAGGEASRD